jgi:hypothetical protein
MQSNDKVVVVIDTSSIFDDHFLTRPGTLALLSLCLHPQVEVILPQATLTEHTKHALQAARTHVENMRKFLKFSDIRRDPGRLMGISAVLHNTPADVYYGDEEPETVLGSVDFWHLASVKALQRVFGFHIAKAGHADLDKVVGIATNARKPFKEKGIGIADYVIWVTGVAAATDTSATVIALITNNTSDFAASRQLQEGCGGIHPELTQMLPHSLREKAFVCTSAESVRRSVLQLEAGRWTSREFCRSVVAEPPAWESMHNAALRSCREWAPVRVGETALSHSRAIDDSMLITGVTIDIPETYSEDHSFTLSPDYWTTFTAGDGRLAAIGMLPGSVSIEGEALVIDPAGKGTVVPTWFANTVEGDYERCTVSLTAQASVSAVAFFDEKTRRCEEIRLADFFDEPRSKSLLNVW